MGVRAQRLPVPSAPGGRPQPTLSVDERPRNDGHPPANGYSANSGYPLNDGHPPDHQHPLNHAHPRPDRRPTRILRSLPYALWVMFAAAYTALSLTRFSLLSVPSWDNAIFQQAISGYAHLRAPIVDIKGPGYNILGDHFSPVLMLLAPVYRVFPFAQTLLVAQAVLISAAVVPVTRAALRYLGTAGGLAIGIACALSFGVQSAVYTDFHEIAFAVPLVAFAGEAYLRRRWRVVAAWTFPLLLVKEDLGITVAMVGVVLFIAGVRRLGLWLAGTGVAAFLLVLFVLIPAFNPAGRFDYWSTVSFGSSGPGALTTFFTGWDLKALTLLLTLGITGFLCLRSPWALLAVPTLAWRWVGQNADYWDTNWHYSAILMPVVFIALVDAIVRLRAGGPSWLRRYAEHVPTLAAAVALVLCLQFPLSNLFKAQTYHPGARVAASRSVIHLIPPGASVETNLGLVTHLVTDYSVYWFTTVGTAVPDYVLIDTATDHKGDDGNVVTFAQRQHSGTRYRLVVARDGFELAVRAS